MPREAEGFFVRQLFDMLSFEKDLEVQKINLSLREDFNLIDAFGMLDEEGRGTMSPLELYASLRELDVNMT